MVQQHSVRYPEIVLESWDTYCIKSFSRVYKVSSFNNLASKVKLLDLSNQLSALWREDSSDAPGTAVNEYLIRCQREDL